MTTRLVRTARDGPRAPAAPGGRLRRWAPPAAAAAVLAAAVVLRFRAPAGLWLDEAQSVGIARLPPGDGVAALRRDGSPPLYYLLLHGWMRVFGDGDLAVRSLSGALSVAALPLAWLCGARFAGRRAATAALLLTATSPWMVRYATETRMYALLVMLVLVGLLALEALYRRPTLARAAGVAAVAAALLLTHYWSFFLVAVVGVGLAWRALRRRRRWAGYAAAATGAGALLFAPWLPAFAYQLAHTGTPWAERPGLRDLVEIPRDWAGRSVPLTVALCALLALGGVAVPRRRLVAARWTAGLAATVLVTTLLAWAAATAGVGALTSRYTAVVVPLALLLAALGAAALPARLGYLVVAVVAALGLAAAVRVTAEPRTQAPEVARAIAATARPGDVVAFCPDQLGPSVARELTGAGADGVRLVTYPAAAPPDLVDWVDYAERNARADPRRFAAHLHRAAGPVGRVFLVQAPHPYRTLGTACGDLATLLDARRGGHRVLVGPDAAAFEQMRLLTWPAGQRG